MKIINEKMLLTVVAVAFVAVSSFGATYEDVAARKRRIHEERTGQKLDENGKTIWSSRQTASDNGTSKRPMLKAAAKPLKVSNVKMTQRKDSKWVDVTYDLEGGSGSLCSVKVMMCDDKLCIPAETFDGDGIGDAVRVGKNKRFAWNAGADWPDHYSKKVNATITATETDIPESWHTIRVKWAGYNGRDLDICGYWVDRRTDVVGWSWGNGTETGAYRSRWHGDNTESGPEIIDVSISPDELKRERRERKYKIHFNYYGEMGSPCRAEVSVDGTSLFKSQSASKRLETCAKSTDPGIIITFDASGKPVAID